MNNKVLITGDIFRPHKRFSFIRKSDQNRNISFLHELLSPTLTECSFEVDKLLWDKFGGETQVDVEQIYKNENITISNRSWGILSNKTSISDESATEIVNFFSQYKFVIAFELPKFLKILLTKNEVIFIDFVFNPIRFLDDIFFAVYSNDAYYQTLFKKIEIDDNYLNSRANCHIEGIKKKKGFILPKNAALLLGQTKIDRSLFTDTGRIKNLYEFEDKIKDICTKYDNVFYKKHPGIRFISPRLRYFLWRNGIKIISHNSYEMLCDENLRHVYSISSGMCEEVCFFGKESTYLSEHNPLKEEMTKYIPAFPVYTQPDFWPGNIRNWEDNLKKNFLRNRFSAFWGHK